MCDPLGLMGKSTGSGHVPQPRDQTEPVVRAEEEAASLRDADQPLGPPGRPMNRGSAFFIGFTGAVGALTALCAGLLVVRAVDVLILMLVAFFTAVGLHPAVTWLNDRGVPNPLATSAVVVGVVLLLAGFLAAALVPLVDQADQLAHQLGELANTVRDQDSLLGRLNTQFHLERELRGLVGGDAGARAVVEGVTGVFVVLLLTVYFLVDFRRIRAALYRFVPARRRPRAILIGDQIYARIGAYLLGNLLVSLVAGTVSFACLAAFRVPYALFLAIMFAVLDLVPLVGTLVAAVGVAAVALTVSVPTCLGVLGVLAVYKVVEDWVLLPKVIGRAVSIPAVVTVVAVLLGGVLAGVAGALVSIPVAAAALLILREVSFPWLDRT
jgi:predicted PurR-regulated permease PerM